MSQVIKNTEKCIQALVENINPSWNIVYFISKISDLLDMITNFQQVS